MTIRTLIILGTVALATMVLADDYVDDVYYWPSAVNTTIQTGQPSSARSVRTLPDTIIEQPADTVVRITIRR